MKIYLNEIQMITSLLLSKLKESKGNEIEINSDFYWDINIEEIFNPYEEPKEISLGQLTDDVEELQKVLQTDKAISYDLNRLSNVIRALGIENRTAF